MEIAAPYYRSTLLPILRQLQQGKPKFTRAPNSAIPMSQGFHHDIFGFADGLDRPMQPDQSVHQDPRTTSIYNQTAAAAASGNMLSEMFNFSPSITATDLLANQISAGYGRFQRDPPVATPLMASHDWYGGTANIENAVSGTGGLGLGQLRDMAAAAKHNHAQALPPGLNADSASAMQLYLMNPPPSSVTQAAPRSHSPSSTTPQALPLNHDFIAAAAAVGSSFAGGVGEGQGLSLSLSSSMQQFDIEKAEELRARNGLYYYNNQLQHQLQGQQSQHFSQQSHVGFSGHQIGTMNILRHSKYTKAAQELLEEFCSVGRGQLMKGKKGKRQSSSSQFGGSGGGGGASSSSSKDPPVPSQSPSDRFEHQIRRKAKLLSMLVEVDRRYNHYCEQMQMVVNSFDTIMGFGAATPYTGLAQKAMSRHFRCLKDNIAAQLKHTCELLGEKDTGIGSGITKGETPRLKLLDQNLRQQRSFHQMGMMEQEAWRPQRGLPERSVNALRAWLFEHFLHPYPSDADKHLLARQTGLTRNQVSNWFINARVRLWKPMVEEMYLQESKEEENKEREDQTSQSLHKQKHHQLQQSQRPPAESSGTKSTGAAENKNVHSHHLTPMSIPKQQLHQPFSSPSSSENPLSVSSSTNVGALPGMELLPPARVSNISGMNPESMIGYGPGTQVRFGTHGDVSLTLGLRQTGNMPDQNNRFSLGDFNGR